MLKTIPKMFKLIKFQNYFKIFYIFGLNPLVSFHNRHSKQSLFFAYFVYFPRILNVSYNSVVAYFFIEQTITSKSSADFVLIKLLYIDLILSGFVAVFENIFKSHFCRIILQSVHLTIENLELSLKIKFPYVKFKKCLHKIVVLMLLIIIGGLIIKWTIPIPNNAGINNTNYVLWSFSTLFNNIHLFHILFYIYFIKFTLECLNEKLEVLRRKKAFVSTKIINSCVNEITSIYLMQQIKLVHLKLWHVSHRVNTIFGWFLVYYFIETTLIATYTIYWMFFYISTTTNVITLLRKYNFFLD